MASHIRNSTRQVCFAAPSRRQFHIYSRQLYLLVWLASSLLLFTPAAANAATLPGGFTETVIASGMPSPTAMAFAPDGRLFVCQQGGQLRIIKNGVLLPTPFVSLTVDPQGERGLLGIAFDPNFSANQYVYLYYTATTPTIHNRVSRFTANGDVAAPGSEVVIMDLENLGATNHNGGAMNFGADGKLYIAVGENAAPANSQTLANRLGKMLRINPDGTIPTDNPFFNQASGTNRAIWSLGLRNPFTFAFQPGTNRMFINDVGQNTWEEINDGVAGVNHGWPTCEGACGNPNFSDPVYQYANSSSTCAITGGAFYNPSAVQFPAEYVGDYFFADFCAGWIKRLDFTNGAVISDFASGVSFPVDLKVGPDGSLYYLARGGGGTVFRAAFGLQYYPLPNPVRLLDTRSGQPACDMPGAPLTGGATRTQLARTTCTGIPDNAQAIVGNATAVNDGFGATGGFITLYPSGLAQPVVSNLNYTEGQVVPNFFTVDLGGDGAFNILATSTTDLIVDVTGYYAPPGAAGGLYYHPLPGPVRLLDTRSGQPACDTPGTPLAGGTTRTEPARVNCGGATIPANALAVVGNATVVNDVPGAAGGFITLYPSGAAQPTVSNLNYVPGQVVPNAFTVALGGGDGAFNIYAETTTNFIVDITGYYSDQATDVNGAGLLYYSLATPLRLLDTRPGQPACVTPGAPLTGGADRTQAARSVCAISAASQVILGNATVVNNVPGAGGGFITLYPSGVPRPTVSNLNYVPGQVVANAFAVRLGSAGSFNIYAQTSTNFITDVTGYFAP